MVTQMADLAIDKLKRLLAKDEQYERFKKIVLNFSMREELEILMKEVETLHATRKGRKLYRTAPNPRDIIDASLEDSSFRSRAVEIMMRMMRSQRAIEKAIDSVSGYIFSEYGQYMEARTKAERERSMRSINQRALQYLNELESAIEVIKVFIDDCDKSAWQFKSALEGVKIIYQRESVISQNA